MSNHQGQVNRYAQAVLQAMLERWDAALNQAAQTLDENAQLGETLSNKNNSADARRSALAKALGGDAPAEVMNLLLLMGQEGDLGLVSDVSRALTESVSGTQAPMKAEVVSAAELSEADRTQLRDKLIKEYGDGLVFSFRVDPSLMGGLRVRVGDHLIDTSVASRLATLRESLTSAVR
ncbi:MAG: ATP synthase F1 subunit delta [Caldilineaceae bacterium]|nr:ATP synthase F1 subunit delta [Caldilineaceae bacterium]MCB9138369.1 ATP synthase F1 subunit delta [Caldilineaceae bacterium]